MQKNNSSNNLEQTGLRVKLNGVRLAGVHSCVPKEIILNDFFESSFGGLQVEEVAKLIGVQQRRFAPDGVAGSDLTLEAATNLLKELDWEPNSIDALIYVSQTSDYKLPATACILQKKLGLNNCAAFDINLGCSAYPYALWTGMSLLKASGLSRVLVCVTEVMSKVTDMDDRATALLFGDAATVSALELNQGQGYTYFVLGTDGGGFQNLIIADGIRGVLDKAITEKKIAKPNKLYMDGWNVFNFTIGAVPKLITQTMDFAKLNPDDIDYFLLHQANAFMLDHLIKKSKLSKNRTLRNIQNFGNTSCASIPLLITTDLMNKSKERSLKLALVGFGVGYSWASAIIDIDPYIKLGFSEI
jgi:3-oxoacyl-[acyl-carrier-protein] synthase-3